LAAPPNDDEFVAFAPEKLISNHLLSLCGSGHDSTWAFAVSFSKLRAGLKAVPFQNPSFSLPT
jgi:hypothetical protein